MIKKVKIVLNDTPIYKAYIFNDEDEQKAVKECDAILKENGVNDGCTLTSLEDYIGVNSHLAEMFDDDMNLNYYMEYDEDAKEDLIIEISENFFECNWSEEMLQNLTKYIGI